MAQNQNGEPAKSPQLFELFSVPESLFTDTLAGVAEDVDPGKFLRGFFQQDTKTLTTPVPQPPVVVETSLDDDDDDYIEETKESLPSFPVKKRESHDKQVLKRDSYEKPVMKRESSDRVVIKRDSSDKTVSKRDSSEKSSIKRESPDKPVMKRESSDRVVVVKRDSSDKIANKRDSSESKQSQRIRPSFESEESMSEISDNFTMEPPEAILRGPSLRSEDPSDESAKLRVIASRSNSVRGGPQVRLGAITSPISFSPGSDSDSEIVLNSSAKGKGKGPPKPLTLGIPPRGGMPPRGVGGVGSIGGANGGGSGVGGSGGGVGGGLAARRGLVLNRTISDPVKKAPTLRERMKLGGGGLGGGAGGKGGAAAGGGGLGLVIDTKSAHENRFSSAWEGVRLKAPSAVRLRQTKTRSGEDSPTVLKLMNATKLCIKGLLLDLEQRRFAALARELIRRGYAPPPGVIDYPDTSMTNKRQRSSLTHQKRERASLMAMKRRRSTATTLPGEKEASFSHPPRRSLMGSVFKSFSSNKEVKQSGAADGYVAILSFFFFSFF
jgi:hypothetical protein